jgi:hypothetical protein
MDTNKHNANEINAKVEDKKPAPANAKHENWEQTPLLANAQPEFWDETPSPANAKPEYWEQTSCEQSKHSMHGEIPR